MKYRKDKISGKELSILGFGCMRLPGTLGRIDREKAEKLLFEAYEKGVNYFDTAYIYPGSEDIVGGFLDKYKIREKIFLATKLPHGICKDRSAFDKIFEEQKRRLRTNYIDYYLIHNISEFKQWENLCKIGLPEWIADKKASGEIKQIGFSYHGSQHDFIKILDAYDWEFVQIQYNYININYQAGEKGLKHAAKKGIPVIIMEPLLGGKLVNGLPKEALKVMQEASPNSTAVNWALKWLWNQPEVTVVLSGMNTFEQLKENIAIADTSAVNMFGENETKAIQKVIDIFNDKYKIRCTGCNYCMPCVKNINIPACFSAYNTSFAIGRTTGWMQYLNIVGLMANNARFASDCIGCRKCESHCPQGIKISEELKLVKRRLELPGIKPISKLFYKFVK